MDEMIEIFEHERPAGVVTFFVAFAAVGGAMGSFLPLPFVLLTLVCAVVFLAFLWNASKKYVGTGKSVIMAMAWSVIATSVAMSLVSFFA